MFDPEAFGVAMADMVKAAMEPMRARLDQLEAALKAVPADVSQQVADAIKSLPIPKDGKDGDHGKSVDMSEVAKLIKAAVDEIPRPKDGADGQDGKSVEISEVRQMVKAAVDEMPKPRDGADGKSIDPADLMKMVSEAVAQIPKPKDGQDGKRGLGVSGAMIDREGSLLLTFEDGQIKSLGRVVGKDGEDGKKGEDGVSFDTFELEYDPDANEMIVSARVGERKQILRHPVSGLNARGYWRDGIKAKTGEGYSLDGSLYIAQRDTGARPSGVSPDWVLAARKGKDGENGKSAPGLDKSVSLKVS